MAAAYPAGVAGVGLVDLDCKTDENRKLSGCSIFGEAPVHRGFGVAALKVAPLFKASPTEKNATSSGEDVNIQIEFYPPTENLWDEDEPFIAAGQDFTKAGQPGANGAYEPIIRAPTADQMAALYPQKAADHYESRGAKLGCEVTQAGDLDHCIVMAEDPPWEGFGDAALAAAKGFKLKTVNADGSSNVGRVFRTKITFTRQ